MVETLRRPSPEMIARWRTWFSKRYLIAQMRKRGEPVPMRWTDRLTGRTLAHAGLGTGLTVEDRQPLHSQPDRGEDE